MTINKYHYVAIDANGQPIGLSNISTISEDPLHIQVESLEIAETLFSTSYYSNGKWIIKD